MRVRRTWRASRQTRARALCVQVNARVVAVLGSWLSETSIVMAGLLKAIKTVQVRALRLLLLTGRPARPYSLYSTVLHCGAVYSVASGPKLALWGFLFGPFKLIIL